MDYSKKDRPSVVIGGKRLDEKVAGDLRRCVGSELRFRKLQVSNLEKLAALLNGDDSDAWVTDPASED